MFVHFFLVLKKTFLKNTFNLIICNYLWLLGLAQPRPNCYQIQHLSNPDNIWVWRFQTRVRDWRLRVSCWGLGLPVSFQGLRYQAACLGLTAFVDLACGFGRWRQTQRLGLTVRQAQAQSGSSACQTQILGPAGAAKTSNLTQCTVRTTRWA